MSATDAAFAGSIPGLYDRFLGPLLFQPYAREVARRVRSFGPRSILETAAGTGIVTQAIQTAVPNTDIRVTDLNAAMLDVAQQRLRSDRIRFQTADAQDLPFEDQSFDLVVCQFGIMFYPDKVRGNIEARRVLCDGGRYLMVIWDSLDANPVSKIVHETVAALYPDDSPAFFARTPFGYSDVARIEQDLLDAGFTDIELETVGLQSEPCSAREAAIGLCSGTPLRAEIEQRDTDGLDRVIDAAAQALQQHEQSGRLDSPLSAHVVTAIR